MEKVPLEGYFLTSIQANGSEGFDTNIGLKGV